jgi:ATP-dependent Clp protease adaptor protein ClpS
VSRARAGVVELDPNVVLLEPQRLEAERLAVDAVEAGAEAGLHDQVVGDDLVGERPAHRRPGCGPRAADATLAPMSQTVELPRPAGPDSDLGGHWRVIVRNDDHNTFDHVAHTLARHIPGVSVSKGYAMADLIHNQGQAVVWSGMKEPAELYWELLNDAGLTMAPLEQG